MPPARCRLTFAQPIVIALLISSTVAADEFYRVGGRPEKNGELLPSDSVLQIRFSEAVDVDSLQHLVLQQIEGQHQKVVPVRRATDLTNAAITIVPVDFLTTNSRYELRGTRQVRSRSGLRLQPFKIRFRTTSAEQSANDGLVFEQHVFHTGRSFTTVTLGPDGRLYAASAFGELTRWELDADGKPVNPQQVLLDPKQSRQYIDLEWDPNATSRNLVLWASYAERLATEDDRHYFTGTICRITLNEDGSVRDEQTMVTGLPHGRERQGGFDTLPHQPNGIVFRDGKLYQSIGSTSSSGGPPNWGLPEQPLSACVIEIDPSLLKSPLDVHPNSGFSPTSDSPLQIFATGIRNALELVAHSNGYLYTAVNINDRSGSADGVPDDPDNPGDQNQLILQTTPDHESLLLVRRGRHYGFPNPARGQYVLNGGNPTAEPDPFEISDYPVGTLPETNYAPELCFPIWQYGGTSPNGMIEYRRINRSHTDLATISSHAVDNPHPLTGRILCCFYSAGDIAVLSLNESGGLDGVRKLRGPKGKLQLNGPLDLCMDPETGHLYVADFGSQRTFGADGSLLMLKSVSSAAESPTTVP